MIEIGKDILDAIDKVNDAAAEFEELKRTQEEGWTNWVERLMDGILGGMSLGQTSATHQHVALISRALGDLATAQNELDELRAIQSRMQRKLQWYEGRLKKIPKTRK